MKKIKVYVLMKNDFPEAVFTNKEAAEKLKEYLDNFEPHYHHIHEFILDK